MTYRTQFADVTLGSIVALVAFPLAVGPALGGWLAARRDAGVPGGVVAGLLGGLPWGVLVSLAATGQVRQWGYHDGVVHLGVNPAPAGAIAPWQAAALAAVGGVLGHLVPDPVPRLRAERSGA